MYRLILFGGVTLEGPSGPLTGRIVQRRQLALLSLLARARDIPLSRERAVGILWPECTEDRARARLSDTLYVTRQELGEDAVVPVSDALRLNPDRVWTDVRAFEAAADAGRWEKAVNLYGGPFLEGFYPSQASAFERWVDEERRLLAQRYREGLETLAEGAEGAGELGEAVGWWKRRAAEEPTNSRVAVRLMRALAAAGNVPGALQHARVHELLLEEELNLPLPAEVRSLGRELASGNHTAGRESQVPAKADSPGRPVAPGQSEDSMGSEARPGSDRVPAQPSESEPPTSGPRRERPVTTRARGTRRIFTFGAALLIFVSGIWMSLAQGVDGEAWVRDGAIPEIEELTRHGLYDSAWTVARRARAIAPHDRELARLLPEFTWLWPELHTDPPGARVLHRPYAEPDAPWGELGTTPLDTFRLPLGATVLRLELEGYHPVHMVPDDYLGEFPLVTLDSPGRLPEGMIRIPGGQVFIEGETVELHDFFLGRYPVTNGEYQRFLEAGGYRSPEYWEHPFVLGRDTLSWEEGISRFTDRTGRPGPATWEVGAPPEGTDDHPVGGVSWYEAAAYALFVGEALPSVHHWHRAYGSRFFGEHMVPWSNLHSDGSTPVGTHPNMGPFGTFDMAGNVREWTHNERGAERFTPGAGWDDPEKLALDRWLSRPAFDRSDANGFRLVRYVEDDPGLERALSPMTPRHTPDFHAIASPPTDEEFEIYRRLFTYDPRPLKARFEAADTARHWIRETVSFDAAYEGGRVLLHLYLPRNGSPPFQTVVYWPGAGAQIFSSIDRKTEQHTGFIIQSGRALAFPVLKGTLERLEEVEVARPAATSTLFRSRTIHQVQDVMRTVDYLEARDDIDGERLAYLGWSWGGGRAPLVLALEPRLRAAVLHIAGLTNTRPLTEVDPLNYLSRVDVPVLMLNGELDAVVPFDTHAVPFFELLGTPPENKRLIEAESGHFVTRPLLIRESLDWLDRHVGPVKNP